MNNTKISIIIPTLNEELIIDNTLKGLVKLRKSILKIPLEIEIILVDGDSSDKTREIASKFTDSVIITHPGRASQLNLGAKHANGDILLFLHADTRLPRSALIDIYSAMKNPNVVGGGFFKEWEWPKNGKIPFIKKIRNWLFRGYDRWLVLLNRIIPGDNAIFVKKSVFFSLNGFRNMWICEDLDFSNRLKSFAAGDFRKKPKFFLSSQYLEKIAIIKHPVFTSARRFIEKGTLRVIVWWIGIVIRWKLGWSQEKLKKQYANYD